MTHGEELSSDMHQDSAVLTYLESVLMHRAASAGAGASPDKSSPLGPSRTGRGGEGVSASSPGRPTAPSPARAATTGSALNVKKARLLQSEGGWEGAKRRRVGGQEGRSVDQPQEQPHSTLLASLLQSFGSNFQDQHRGVSPGSRASSPDQEEEEPGGCRRLGALLDGRRAEEARRHSPSVVAAAPRLCCSARLKAVASMVGKSPGPPSSPKPSAACSQLALLLSSDCQLQQYSRARSVAPSASQRLAAIASKKLTGVPQERSAGKSPSGPRERVSRSPASPSAGSSLLMHLLNSPKTPAANGHGWATGGESVSRPRSRPSVCDRPLKEEREEGRSDPGSRSNCAPMDLSTKPRACEPISFHSSSLEQMTESLLFSWNPRVPGLRGPEVKEDEEGPETKSHHKVTLLQLLLGHHGGTKGSRTPEPSGEAPLPATPGKRPSLLEPFPPCSSSSSSSSVAERSPCLKPRSVPGGRQPQLSPAHRAARIFPAQGDQPRKARQQSPAAEPAKAHSFLEQPLACESPRAAPFPKQLFPLELRQGSPVAPLAADGRLSNFSFSASKLLHDLAHTGSHKSPEPSPMDPELRSAAPGSLEPKLGKECALKRSADMLSFQLSDPGTGQERTTAPDLEHLLERRSVLQLLLKTPEKEQIPKSHPQGRRGDQLVPEESRSCAEVISMVKVKTEPNEDETRSFSNAEASVKCPRRVENLLPLENLKQEVVSPSPPAPIHSAPRGGVLSQLLLRHSGPSDNYLSGGQSSLETSAAHANPCPVSRMRPVLPGSPPERRELPRKLERPVALNGHSFCSNGLSESAAGSRGSCKPQECQTGPGGGEEEPGGYLKDAQEFNVLKQLLLSENGIKVLSQHRTLQNGGSTRDSNLKAPGENPALYYRQREQRGSGKESPVGVKLSRYPGAARLPPPQRGAQSEPPWLTKANPILYYMLQRGGGEAPPFGLSAPRAGEADAARRERKKQPQRSESRAGPGWVKEEAGEPLACFGSRPTQPPPTPGQILEKVAAIKREPD